MLILVQQPIGEVLGSFNSHELPWTPLVLGAVNSSEGRRDIQRLWPDQLIDAQTGDTMLGIRDYRRGRDPCMFCVFPVDDEGRSGADIVAQRLGLPAPGPG